MAMLLIMVSAAASVITCVLVGILMFTGRADADLTPVYKALRDGRDELRDILGGQSQALDARLNNLDTNLRSSARQQTDEVWGVAQRITGSLTTGLENVRKENEAKLEAVRNTVAAGLKDNETRLNLVRTTVTEALDKVRRENETKLEAIRGTVVTMGSTFDNAANLAPSYLDSMRRKYEGTRLGRQELYAEILEDMEGALWSRPNIDKNRIRLADLPPLKRIVVAIDPSVSSSENSDECGVVCCGIDDSDPPQFFVLDDVSAVMSPLEWSRTAVSLYHARRADRVIGEANNGGDLIESTLRHVDQNVSYAKIHATKGKFVRAEPISALYEQNRVHHVGPFPKLEDQMTSFCVDFDRRSMGYSPDRLDALVWALTELSESAADTRRPLFIGFPMGSGGGSWQPSAGRWA